jgi:two-component system nitrogen regulation sensor histidine kinase NtrY
MADAGVQSGSDSSIVSAPMGWRRRMTSRYALGTGYALAAALTAVAVWMASSAPVSGPVGPPSTVILVILAVNLLLIVGLAIAVGTRVWMLFQVQRRDAGARLHLRFVALFATAAVAPAVIVALVFGVLINQAVESWFSTRVATVVDDSATVARSYHQFQITSINHDVQLFVDDLNRAASAFRQTPILFNTQVLAQEAAYRNFPGAYLLDRDGRILARVEAADSPPTLLMPPPSVVDAADQADKAGKGELVRQEFDSADQMKVLVKLKAYDDAYLYVVRPIDKGILAHLRETNDSVAAYKDTAANRGRIKASFELSYVETVLLVLVGAVWLGLTAANSISGPVARLVQAADRVAGGDLAARVAVEKGPQELTDLAKSFNRMTADLQTQQSALKAAGDEAESRRQFIETVLSGVSAGVIGLDRDGRISAANRQAHVLLALPQAGAHGELLSDLAPEFAELVDQAAHSGSGGEAEIDITRGADTRRLRLRASGASDDGLVLTFDDITRLVAAQRNAAWKDVARRIAHEIKNPLTPIQLSAERLRRKYRKDIKSDLETFDRCTETIIRQVGDIGRMVDEFSAFARMPTPVFTRTDAAEMLREAVFAQRVANPNIDYVLEDPLPEAQALCDARMVGQALTNVLKNAAEAIAGRRATDPSVRGRILARLVLGEDDLAFEIEDNGIGLPTKDRDRLTEPYVTTREKGTGLGLAIVKRIVEDHGGELALLDAARKPGAMSVLKIPRLKTVEHEAANAAAMA